MKMPRYYKKKKFNRFSTGSFTGFVDRSPVPLQKFAELTITDILTISAPNTGLFGTEWIYSLNGLYDPYLGAGGHQPYGFDQFCPTLYGRYKVYNTTIIAKFYDPTADGTVASCVIVPAGTTYTTTGKNHATIREAPISSTKFVSTTGNQRTTIYCKLPMHVLFGVYPNQFKSDLDNTTGDSAGNPGVQPKLLISACNDRLTADTIMCEITIKYWAMFYERTPLAPS